MAEYLLDSYLTCSLCLDTFTEPLTLSCNHSFCSSCLHQRWREQPSRTCPVCQSASEEEPKANSALKKLSEHRQKQRTPASPPQAEQREAEQKEDASAQDEGLRELISTQIQSLKEEKTHCKEVQQVYKKIERQSEEQAGQCERHIRAVFSGLNKFLQEEEQRALSALREEQLRQKQSISSELQRVTEAFNAVSNSIEKLEKCLQTRTYRQPPSMTPHLQPKAGLRLDQAKLLGNLGFRVWRNMRREVQHRPVVLDPNTASREVLLSEDLSSVRLGDEEDENIPLNAERFLNYTSVLGSEGFSSGVHQWDVEVGDNQDWAIGVVKESYNKRDMDQLGPDHGHFCLGLYSGTFHNITYKTFEVRKRPQKIRVHLDYDRGQLTFSDAERMTTLCSHQVSFTEKVFPYIWMGQDGVVGKTKELRICTDALMAD